MSDVVEPDQIRLALTKICTSEQFAGSQRLQALLTYVVEETLAGRADLIRAKTIGLDVHKYSSDEIAEREGVVRVDAGRVRRKLEDYYTRGGVFDPVRISLPVGRYVPHFEVITRASETQTETPPRPAISLKAMGALAGILAVSVAAYMFMSTAYPTSISNQADIDRSEIFDISPKRIEAANLAEIGRDLIFPAIDPKRHDLALEVFLAAIEKDETYFGGYAGAAQVTAVVSMLARDAERAADALEQAQHFSRQALRIGPSEAWALSAAAWVSFAENDDKAAVELSKRAYDLAPLDPHIAEFDALISLYQSDFERIFENAKRREESKVTGQHYVFQNVLGSAHFHTGNYTAAISAFKGAIATGAPFGPMAIGYLAASHAALGQKAEAKDFADLLEQTWPGAKPELVQMRLFSTAEPGEQFAQYLRSAADQN